MLAIFLDVQNEILEIGRELDVMNRKMLRYEQASDIEDKDSHMRAVAGCIHGIYSGMEKILKDLVNHKTENCQVALIGMCRFFAERNIRTPEYDRRFSPMRLLIC